MIQFQGVTKEFGDRTLFRDVTFALNPRERISLIGRNGTGKSTLFKLILGEELPDGGTISIPKGYTIGSLKQHLEFTKPTVLEECSQVLPKEQQFDHYRVERILFGLGFSAKDMSRHPSDFSGGYQIRINLGKVLLQEPQLLLLDEPTNYLDIVSQRWLKDFLKSFPGEVILISHDRDFLDQVATHTMGLSRGKLRKIAGDCASYFEAIVADEEIYEKTRVNQEKKIAHMMDFVDKNRAKASKATQAQSRLKAIEKIDVLDKLTAEQDMNLRFQYSDMPAKVIMHIEDVGFGYDPQRLLFNGLNFSLGKGDRIGIIGKNGKGKSTLMNLLAGELKAVHGQVRSHAATVIGHFGQTNIERLDSKMTPESEIRSANSDLGSAQIRGICGAMMFEGDDAAKSISVLSGGEKSRVMLGKLIANKTNVLMLDEPTNHLDVESIEVLVNSLANFEGAVVIVTHSEMILRELCNKFVVFHHDQAEFFLGDYDDFLAKIGWGEDGEQKAVSEEPKLTQKEYKHLRAQLMNERAKAVNPLKKQVEELENLIDELEGEVEDFTDELERTTDNDKMVELSRKIGEANDRIEEAFARLEEVVPDFDKVSAEYDLKVQDLESRFFR